MRVVTIASQRGNVGKTTTAVAVAQALSAKGKRVLAVDLDPQADMSLLYGVDSDRDGLPSAASILEGTHPAEVIVHTLTGDVIPASIGLSAADMQYTSLGRERLLSVSLEKIADSYDYAVVDTPPNLGVLAWNAFVASDGVLVPVSVAGSRERDLELLAETLAMVKRNFKPSLKVWGAFVCRFDSRSEGSEVGCEDTLECAQKVLGRTFDTVVREGSFIKDLNPAVKIPKDYTELVEEVVKTMDAPQQV